jgi:hypothetical protein
MLRMILEAAWDRLVDHASKAKKETFVNVADVSAVRYEQKQIPPTITSELKI